MSSHIQAAENILWNIGPATSGQRLQKFMKIVDFDRKWTVLNMVCITIVLESNRSKTKLQIDVFMLFFDLCFKRIRYSLGKSR